MVSAILSSFPERLNIESSGQPLKQAFKNLLNQMEGERVPNKKLL